MDAQASGTADGTQIQEWWCNGTGAQSFSVEDAGNGAYFLVNANANKCVDVAARGTANGTKIQLYECNGTPAQAFSIQPRSERLRELREHEQREVPRRRRRQSSGWDRRAAIRLQRNERPALEPGGDRRGHELRGSGSSGGERELGRELVGGGGGNGSERRR